MLTYSLRITFTTELLGAAPLDESIYSSYIASRAPAEAVANGHTDAELAAVALAEHDARDIKGRTGFLRDETGRPLVMDYVLRGYLKDAWRAMSKIPGTESAKLKAGLASINRYAFVEGAGDHADKRYIVLRLPHGGAESVRERSLRASTPQGERIALAASEQLPVGTWCDIKLAVLHPGLLGESLLRELLDYGQWQGLGQWRNASNGRFRYTLKPWA